MTGVRAYEEGRLFGAGAGVAADLGAAGPPGRERPAGLRSPSRSLRAAQRFVVCAAVPEDGLGAAGQVLRVKWTLAPHPLTRSVGVT
ncbi:hypothetical protein AB0D91_30535 [Streptomyces canus]|uniref:hypothetical protein n=1 Tax=Streptomyces canus TaxID=58343 RepID=UPI0033CD3BAD